MNKELFSKKLVKLRKKYNFTQQELANKLNVSNKTVSRWETGESYPDIELLPILASIYHVSIDYLLSEHEDYQDIDKTEIASYIPWIIGIVGILIYFIFINLSIPAFFSFFVYYFIVRFSYDFLNKYTDKKNLNSLVYLNTVSAFFVVQSFCYRIIFSIEIFSLMNTFSYDMESAYYDLNMSSINGWIVLCYIIGGIYAFFHYMLHIQKKDKDDKKSV